jgi:hypothetical protein
LRRFWRPFLLIQLLALALVVAYHVDARVRALCATFAAVKVAGGLPFAATAAAFAGGVLPELAKMIAGRGAGRAFRGRGPAILFNIAFFAFNGLVVDVLYRTMAWMFGSDTRLPTVMAKVAFDQFVFTPVWLVIIVGLYLWRGRRFSWAATRSELGRGFYRKHVLPLLLPDWFFWIPMVAVIYAFPLPLQFLLFTLALAAWSLIMVVIAGGGGSGSGSLD